MFKNRRIKRYGFIVQRKFNSFKVLWTGGEARTWIVQGTWVGGAIGLVLGLIATITIEAYFSMPDQTQQMDQTATALLYIPPVLGLVFGAIAGAIIGIGTPRHNPNPQQGGYEKLPLKNVATNIAFKKN